MDELPALLRIHWFELENAAGQEIPAHAIMRCMGKVTTPAGELEEWRLKVGQADGSPAGYLFNGPLPIPSSGSKTGSGHADHPAIVAYDPSQGLPAVGEVWGPAAGNWKIVKLQPDDQPRFVIVGVDSTNQLAAVMPAAPEPGECVELVKSVTFDPVSCVVTTETGFFRVLEVDCTPPP